MNHTWRIYITLPHHKAQDHLKEGVERCREPEGGEDPREAVSSGHDKVGALRSSGYLELPAQGLD